MTKNTILILGAGPRVGWSLGKKFKAEGYQVVVTSRKPDTKPSADGFVSLAVDLGDIKSIEAVFAQVKEKYGIPNVVVYNAAALTFPADQADPFGISPEDFAKDTNVNTVGAYVAVREALKGFKELGPEVPKAFVATGNVLPYKPWPAGVTLGTGKAGLAHLINVGAEAYKSSNFKFYYASEVSEVGGPVMELSGDAHASIYWQLVNQKEQGQWEVRFLANGDLVTER